MIAESRPGQVEPGWDFLCLEIFIYS